MASVWPWLAVAAAGALHGLNPACGWMPAVAWGARSQGGRRALRALAPIALGHVAALALVAVAAVRGWTPDRALLQVLAGVLLVVVAAAHLAGRVAWRTRLPAGQAGLALWSFLMSGTHGAGLALVPALMPLCAGGAAAGGTDASAPLVLAAIGVHTAAMLAVTGAMAVGAGRSLDAVRAWKRSAG